MLGGPYNVWKWVELNLGGDESQFMKPGLYFGGTATTLKGLSLEDMMKAVL